MAPRLIADRIVHHAANVVGALAVGVLVAVAAPSSAFAAPAQAAKPDLVPHYAGSYSGYDDIPLEQRVTIWPTVRNAGGQTAHGVRMVVSIPAQLTNVTVSQGYFSCSSNPGTRGKTVIVCDTDQDLAPAGTLGIEIHGNTSQVPGGAEVIVTVDPENAIGELDETNNTKISRLVTN